MCFGFGQNIQHKMSAITMMAIIFTGIEMLCVLVF